MTTTQRIAGTYHRMRRDKGHLRSPHYHHAALATYRTARILERWRKALDAGLVRLRIVPDDVCTDIDDLAGDTFNPDVNPDIPPARLERERQEFIDKVNRDGVWGIVGEYRLAPCEHAGELVSCQNECFNGHCDGWEHGDSCYGYVGDDATDESIQSDIMSETLHALTVALRSRQILGM